VASTVAEVMTRNPATIDGTQTVGDAARLMRKHDTGAIVVTTDGQVSGIVTDRDIAVRVVADGKSGDTPVREAYSADVLRTVGPDTSIDQAVQIMRQAAVRRLPVVENNHAVGIVSMGDLAIEQDENSALADVSAAEGNQ
jgi:CBS domain-containing protein